MFELLHELAIIERLRKEAVGSALRRFDRHVDRAVGGQYDHRQSERAILHFGQQIETVFVLETEIEEHGIDHLALQDLQGRATRLFAAYAKAVVIEPQRYQLT